MPSPAGPGRGRPALIGEVSYLRSRKRTHGRSGLLMTLPVQVLFAFFFIVPFAYAVYYSLTSPLTGGFVGLRNFKFTVESATFWQSVLRLAYFGVVQVTAMVILALALAFLIDSPICAGKRVFRLVFFLPYAIPGVLATLMWGFLFTPALNSLLSFPVTLGISHSAAQPLSSGSLLYAIMLIVTWEWTGYNMTLYLTSLSSISDTVLDAAVIDGCGQFRLVRYIKLPLIRRMLMFTLVLSIIGTLQLFTEPNVLSTLTAVPSTYTPNMAIYNEAFSIDNVQGAASMSLILGAITVGTSLVFFYVWRRLGQPRRSRFVRALGRRRATR